MKITEVSIQKGDKSRCNLFIDGEFRCGISLDTALKYSLKPDMEIDAETLNVIETEGVKSLAYLKGLNYVMKALKTKKQVKTYLINKGFSEDIAYYVIDKLKEYKYIDDEAYAKRYIEARAQTVGGKLAAFKLMEKGVRKDDIERAVQSADVDSFENCRLLAEKYVKNKEKTKETLLKTRRYLLGRGFSFEEVDFAVSKLKGFSQVDDD